MKKKLKNVPSTLKTVALALRKLHGELHRVDSAYAESMEALEAWNRERCAELDRLEEAVCNRYEAIDVTPVEKAPEAVEQSDPTQALLAEVSAVLSEIEKKRQDKHEPH